jgi:hypothetical protein
MIIQYTNKKSALYCKNGSYCHCSKHRYRISGVAIFNTVVAIMLVLILILILVLVNNNFVYSFVSTLYISYSLSFVFISEEEHNDETREKDDAYVLNT